MNIKTIVLFEFQPMNPSGCRSHPKRVNHKKMDYQVNPFFKKLLDEK